MGIGGVTPAMTLKMTTSVLQSCPVKTGRITNEDRRSADVKSLAQARIEDMRRKIVQLQDMANTLETLVDSCVGDDRADCPILKALEAPIVESQNASGARRTSVPLSPARPITSGQAEAGTIYCVTQLRAKTVD